MKKILLALTISGAALVAAPSCTGPDVTGGNDVTVYSDVTLNSGTVLATDSADSCTVGGYTFSNFEVAGGAGDNFVGAFSLNVIATAGGQIEFSYSNLGTADIELYYTVTSGVYGMILEAGTATSVTEVICSAAFTAPNTTCGGTVLNQTTPFDVTSGSPIQETMVTHAGVDYIANDILGGSEIFAMATPEPATFSLLGVGLLGLGLIGRRIRK